MQIDRIDCACLDEFELLCRDKYNCKIPNNTLFVIRNKFYSGKEPMSEHVAHISADTEWEAIYAVIQAAPELKPLLRYMDTNGSFNPAEWYVESISPGWWDICILSSIKTN